MLTEDETTKASRRALISVLRDAQAALGRRGNDFSWSSWDGADKALEEIAAHIATLESGRLPNRLDLEVLFAPTGPVQEVSISSGWGEEFLVLSSRFDGASRRAYRWSLVAAIRASVAPRHKR